MPGREAIPLGDGTVLARAADRILAEWIKIGSVRATYGVTLVGLVTSAGFGAWSCASLASDWGRYPAARAHADRLSSVFDGLVLAQLVFASIGVLAITSEYSSGLIRTTFTASPGRRVTLLAKAAALTTFTLLAGAVTTAVTYVLGQLLLAHQHIQLSVTDPTTARAVFASVVYLIAVATLGLGLGAVLRHAAAAVSTLFAVLFLLPQLLRGTSGLLLAIDNALPGTALRRLMSDRPWAGAPSTREAWLVIVAFPLVSLVAAMVVIGRRDA